MTININKKPAQMIRHAIWMSPSMLLLAASFSQAAVIAEQVVRTNIVGIDVIAYPTNLKDVVTIKGSLPAGDAFATENIALASLAGLMLDKGTQTRDMFQIAKELDQVGAQLGFNVGTQSLTIQGRSLKANLPLVLKILADELRSPAMNAKEFANAKSQLDGVIKQQYESTDARASEAFMRAIYPAGHPNRPPSFAEWHPAIESATLADVKRFHQQFYGPSHMVLVLVGDLDIPKIHAELRKDFGGWTGGVAYRTGPTANTRAPGSKLISMSGKTSVTVLEGQATGLRYRDADSLPLRLGLAALGSGFTGRLMSAVREKEGLTYHIEAGVGGDSLTDGNWIVSASFAPSLLDKGVLVTQREIQRWWQDGVTSPELEAHKADFIGRFQVGLATTGGMSGILLSTVQRGLPFKWIDDYPKSVDAITLDEVNGAIRRYVDPQDLVIVKAGTIRADVAPVN